jgi:glycosyltransferase involved in cell wall biosynthesis
MTGFENSSMQTLAAEAAVQPLAARVLQDPFVAGNVTVEVVTVNEGLPAQTMVVPIFNQERIIAGTIRAFISRISKPSDVVLIFDGCSDGSRAQAELALTSSPTVHIRRVVFITTERPIFETRCDNLGFLVARGETIIEIQADIEVLTPEFDALLTQPMEQNPSIFSVSGRGAHWFGLLSGLEPPSRLSFSGLAWRLFNKCEVGLCGFEILNGANVTVGSHYYTAETVMRGPWALNRRALLRLGLLDEANLFLGNDDHDLHARALHVGLRCAYRPLALRAPLEHGSSRRERSGINAAVYQALTSRPDGSFLRTFLQQYRPLHPCRKVELTDCWVPAAGVGQSS